MLLVRKYLIKVPHCESYLAQVCALGILLLHFCTVHTVLLKSESSRNMALPLTPNDSNPQVRSANGCTIKSTLLSSSYSVASYEY
jgi:hypothetical protein